MLYRTFYANKSEDDATIGGLAHHMALTTLNKYYRDFKPDKIIMCCDRTSWRKEYTLSEAAITKKVYKGGRRQNMTKKEEEKFQKFVAHIREFEDLIDMNTSIITLAGDGLEADDLMAGVCQIISRNVEDEIVLVSADKDMIQLLQYPNVRVIDPATGDDRTLDKWNGDANLFLFEKCVRGEPKTGDNIQSAFPRCKTTRIMRAWEDDFERANFMNTTWSDPEGTEYIVRQLFQENELLMDLSKQPDHIQKDIFTTVLRGLANPGTFSYFKFMGFLGKYEMKTLAKSADNFVELLSR